MNTWIVPSPKRKQKFSSKRNIFPAASCLKPTKEHSYSKRKSTKKKSTKTRANTNRTRGKKKREKNKKNQQTKERKKQMRKEVNRQEKAMKETNVLQEHHSKEVEILI